MAGKLTPAAAAADGSEVTPMGMSSWSLSAAAYRVTWEVLSSGEK